MSEWKTWGHYKRTPWRWVRDLFDDTLYLRRASAIRKRNKKIFVKKENHITSPKNTIQKPEPPPVRVVREGIDPELPQKYHIDPLPSERRWQDLPATKNAFIKTNKIEDYAASSTENVQVITVPTPYFIPIPIKTIKFKIVRTKKIVKIPLPKIKINIPMLKRLALSSLIVTLIVVSFVAAFIFYRGVSLMDGDFIGETYKMKIAEYENNLIVPITARVQRLEGDVNTLRGMKDYQDVKDILSGKYKTPPTLQLDYDSKEPFFKTKRQPKQYN